MTPPRTYAVVTFGCRVNQADSLAIEARLRKQGAVSTPPSEADLVVVNTCSVTAGADQGARQAIRRIARENPSTRILVTGCYATRRPGDLAGLPNVERVVPNDAKETFPFDETTVATSERHGDGDGACGLPLEPGVAGRTALTLRVQTGCDEVCSYCIIPSTRGPGRSRPLREVLAQISLAVQAGYREIVVTGVHLGSYGRDLAEPSSLTTLVQRLAAWPDDVLFRLSSLEPMDCTPEIVTLVSRSGRLAPHFHLPLQHGTDEMLRAMRRPYTMADYVRLVERIRAEVPDAAIGSDIVVGFPGETAAHADAMCARLARLPLTHLHVFPYSDRPGTDAALMVPKVSGLDIRARAGAVRAIGEEMAARFRRSQTGRICRALVTDDGWSAVTGNHLKVRLTIRQPRNVWIDVRIEDGTPLVGAIP